MFFVVFWGRRRRTENWGLVAPARCPQCHRDVFFHHLVVQSTAHVFFIPLSQTTAHALACPSCGFTIGLDDRQTTAATGMSAARTRWEAGMLSDGEHADAITQFWSSTRALDDRRGLDAIGPARPERARPADDTPTGWFADPTGRHDLRFFDGAAWSAFVVDDGETGTDTFLDPRRPGWYPDPYLRHELRRWDGRVWTDQTQDAGVVATDAP